MCLTGGLLVRIQPEEAILTTTNLRRRLKRSRMSVPFSYRPELKKQGAILHVLPPKNPVKHRMVNQPDQ